MLNALKPAWLSLVGILAVGTLYGQKYQYGTVFALGIFVQTEGTIEISDSTVVITSTNEGKLSAVYYALVKRANNLVYFTDGVMTHFFAIMEQSGKKKGFEYDRLIVFTPDKRQADSSISYYAKQLP